MSTLSLEAFALVLARMASQVEAAEHRALEEIGKHVEHAAKEMLGHENEWPELAESTIKDKERLGLPTPSPLLRKGDMKASIGHHVNGHESVAIGSDLDRAKWHEDGTKHFPPRPFLSTAMMKEEAAIKRILGTEIVKVLSGRE